MKSKKMLAQIAAFSLVFGMTGTGSFYDLPDQLIRTANENGGPDNITALLLSVEPMEVRNG